MTHYDYITTSTTTTLRPSQVSQFCQQNLLRSVRARQCRQVKLARCSPILSGTRRRFAEQPRARREDHGYGFQRYTGQETLDRSNQGQVVLDQWLASEGLNVEELFFVFWQLELFVYSECTLY